MQDKLLGRKSNWNWGRNSKREIRYLEKRQMILEILQEAEITEEENRKYKEYLANHWVNQLVSKRG